MISELFGNYALVVKICFLVLCIYPVTGAFFWFWGALAYKYIKTNKRDDNWAVLPKEKQPFITIMIPAHNEEVMIATTITYLFDNLNYDQFEVLVMNDGSTDKTAQIVAALQKKYSRLRTIEIIKNKGEGPCI